MTIEINENYFSAIDALEDLGYKDRGMVHYKKSKKDKVALQGNLFTKNGISYIYVGMENFNTYIYIINLTELNDNSLIL